MIFIKQELSTGIIMERNNLPKLEEISGKHQVRKLTLKTVAKTDKLRAMKLARWVSFKFRGNAQMRQFQRLEARLDAAVDVGPMPLRAAPHGFIGMQVSSASLALHAVECAGQGRKPGDDDGYCFWS